MEILINRAILEEGLKDLLDYSEVDVLIAGAGPSGLTAAKYLAEKGFKVVVYERRLSFGGGIGGGGNLIPKIAVQKEVLPILDDFGIRYKKYNDEVFTLDPAELIAKLSAKALDAGLRSSLGQTLTMLSFGIILQGLLEPSGIGQPFNSPVFM